MANVCKDKSSQNTSSDLANVPRFRIGKFEVWFGYDSETHLFLNSGSFVAWVSFSHRQPTTIATLSMAAMARPARRPWTGPEYEECEDLNAHLWFISAGLPTSLLDSHVPLAQLRLGLCSSSTDFWFGCQPASQPQPESSPSSASSATQQAASHAASQLQLASPIASHPTSSSNWASHPASQPATQGQPA